ncbi:MAG: uroporphyrinogen-III synthase [Hyphomicrobiaceae bacterium]
MRILVTRAEPDASAQAETLLSLGHQVLISPMLEVEICPPAQFELSTAQAVIATSRNGLRAIENHRDLGRFSTLPIYVVGPTTADYARKLGFQKVITGPAAAPELVDIISQQAEYRDDRHKFIYLAAKQPSFDMAGKLGALGFSVDQQVVYHTKAASSFPAPILAAIKAGEIDSVILMSARTAAIFADLLISNGIQEQASTIMFLCFSKAVAEALRDLNPHMVEIAIRPRTEEVLALVHRMEEKSK